MSHPSPFSAPGRQPSRWPIYDPYPTVKRRGTTPLATPGRYSRPLQSSRTSLQAVSTKSQQLVASSDSAPTVEYHLWTPPLRPASPDDELAWSQRIEDSNSTTSNSSDDDDESPAETSLPLVPKQAGASIAALEKDLESDLFAQSHLSNIFVPMAAAQLQAARAGSNHPSNASAGAMQLLAYRSPSVRYDKGLHGAFSPATTVHLALPHAAAVRTQGKPRLPLPASAKAMPRQLQPQQQQQPQNTALPLHLQQQRSRVISQPPPPPSSVTSPPVIGLDLALMPPADHRDSAMSPRNSIAVKTPARPSLLAPVNIPRRVSVGSTQSHTIWKPVSAPTHSPISEGPPQPSVITQAPREPSLATMPIDTHKLSKPPSTSSVSINSSIGSATPSVPASATSSQISLNNERAEIRARTLSSTNLAQRFRTEPPAATPQSRDVSPDLPVNVHPLDNLAEKALSAAPALQSHPVPKPNQPSIMFPADEFEVEEAPAAPLRVINVTNDTDDMVTSPVLNDVASEETVQPTTTTRAPSPVPSIMVVPSTPVTAQQILGAALAFPAASTQSNRFSVSPTPSPTVPEAQNNLPKHASLPPPAHSHTQSAPAVQMTRVSLVDPPVSASYSEPLERNTVSRASRLPPPNTRTWLPHTLVVPTPLSPISALPQAVSQRLSSIQQQQARFQHAHSRSDPLATPLRASRSFTAPMPAYAAPSGYYSSDDDDPSKWAPYPEAPSRRSSQAPSSHRSSQAPSSHRSSRSSRSSFSVNRNSIYGPHAESDEEDGGLLYAPPSISLPNLRPILQGPGESEAGPSRKITFAVPPTEVNKPSQAAGGRRKIRRRSNSTDSVIRGPKQIPWLQESDVPKRGGLVTVPDPFGFDYTDEGRYDVVNHPELVPADVYSRYVRPDGGPKLPEFRETFSAKTKALRAAAEEEQRARILGRRACTPAVSVESEEEVPITVPVCLRRPRAMSESTTTGKVHLHSNNHGNSGGTKLRRRSRSRDRAADWAPPPTIPDPEIPAYPLYSMPPTSTSLFPGALGRMFSKLRY